VQQALEEALLLVFLRRLASNCESLILGFKSTLVVSF